MWGITVETLIAWKPPSKATDAIQEDGVLTLYKLPHSDLQAFTKLENTATHALRDMVSKLISHLPTFKAAMIKSVPDAEKYSKAGFEACMKKALFAGQAADRKAAKDKGKTSRDTRESVGGGNEAKEKWETLEKELLAMPGNVALPMEQRYLVVPIDKTTSMPTVEGLVQLKSQLECVLAELAASLTHSPVPPLMGLVYL